MDNTKSQVFYLIMDEKWQKHFSVLLEAWDITVPYINAITFTISLEDNLIFRP